VSHNPALDSLTQLMLHFCRAEGVTYKCRGRGALLSLPNGGHREDVIRTKAFEDYIRDHIISWFTWAQKNKLGVERMEDLILVSGRTLVASWAAVVFVDNNMEAEISLASRTHNNGGASFVWRKIRGPVVHHNSRFDPVRFPGCVYSACTDFFFIVWKEKSTQDGSMRLHQGLPRKSHPLLDQTNPSHRKTLS
jgi:hypothetical protein